MDGKPSSTGRPRQPDASMIMQRDPRDQYGRSDLKGDEFARSKTATPAAAFTGPARHHGGHRFVHRASALRPSALIRGAPVRRHPAKAEPRASWCAGHRTLGVSPLSCHRAAEATLLSGHPLSRARAVLDPALGVPQALQATRHFRCSFAPLSSAPVQPGFPEGTFSCSTRDGLLSEHNQDDRNSGRVNCGALWKLLSTLLIKTSRTCERFSRICESWRDKWRSTWRRGSS